MPVSFDRVYLQSAGYFMPGAPVSNEQMDAYIAPLNRMSSRIQRRILAENGIRERYYAIDTEGATVFSNAQLAANAIRDCLQRGGSDLGRVSLLASGSSGGDTLMPGFANMIQGELAAPPMETVSVQGICAAGVSAIQAAAQGIELGAHARTLAVASEMPSRLFKRSRFAARGYEVDFDSHFLRWMLSDGAGAVLLEREPRGPLSLRVEWIDLSSAAHELPVCMYAGADKNAEGGLDGWGRTAPEDWQRASTFAVKQDVRLLNENIVRATIDEPLRDIIARRKLKVGEIDWFLPHLSSNYFAQPVEQCLEDVGLPIPRERWFNNLAQVGNTGSASPFIMLDALLRSGRVRKGHKLLMFVPESGRFSSGFVHLEAV